MSADEQHSSAERTITIQDVRTFRQRAIVNGYRPITVRSCSKAPLTRNWQHGEPPASLLDVRPEGLNTGLLLAGFRCIDLDIDDAQLTLEVMRLAHQYLPPRALMRRRGNSPRLALLYRAADGQPAKRVAKGPKGKVEILGRGQQIVVHGLHPSGASITWKNGRGADTVHRDQVPPVCEEQITAFLNACAPLLGASISEREATGASTAAGHVSGLPVAGASLLPHASTPPQCFKGFPVENELGAGITSNWFSVLPTEHKSTLVKSCLDVLDNRTDDPRDVWLQVLFSVADAERLGCLNARQLALEWSRRGASWTSEADFYTAWHSFKAKPGGISVGSLLAKAANAGLDLSPWRDAASPKSAVMKAAETAVPLPSSPKPQLAAARAGRAVCSAQLPIVPPKRQWLHGVDLVRGAVSLLVAPGGRGKSSWLVTLSLACAANRPLLGSHVFGGPLRVLLISAEDPVAEVALRIRAAMQHYGLTDADLPGLHVVGADQWDMTLLCAGIGGPILNKAGWDGLTAELHHVEPDVLIIDPLISVMGGASQNDNAAAALLMRHLVNLAAKRRIGVMVAHHASKGRDPMSAESAMGAASFMNLSRIGLAIEPLAEKDAGDVGLPPWEARNIFRVAGTKHNLSPASEGDRWCRIVSVEICNAQPPIYPNGDKVGVVEVFHPGTSGPRFSPEIVRDALQAINGATIPLSPSKRAAGRYAVPTIVQAIAPHRGGQVSEIEAEAVLDHLVRSALVRVDKVKLARPGGRSDERDGLVLTQAGKDAARGAPATSNQHSPRSPQCPATSMRDDAGGEPPGSPAMPGGCGGNAGRKIAGTPDPSGVPCKNSNSVSLAPSFAAPKAARTRDAGPAIVNEQPVASPEPAVAPAQPQAAPLAPPLAPKLEPPHAGSPHACPSTHAMPTDDSDGLDIPPFLRRNGKPAPT